MTAQPRQWRPLWPTLEQRIIQAQPNGQLPRANADGWIGPIRSPLRNEDKPSFSVMPDSDSQPGGFEDHGTGEKGPLSKLAQLMNIDPRISAATAPEPVAVTLEAFCAVRKLDQAGLVTRWKVQETHWKGRPALRYPTTLGIDRIKYLDKGKGLDKYTWAGTGGHRHWYGLTGALAIGGPLYLVNGEPSVWACQQQGVAAIALCGGEGAAPTAERVAELQAAGVSEVRVVYDRDEKGRQGAPKAVAALLKGGIVTAAYELPAHLGETGDVDDLQRWEGANLGMALAALPNLAAPAAPNALPAPAIFKLSELLTKQFAAVREVIPGILPEGLTLFGGKAKSGKSWTVLDICNAVAAGGYALGKYKVEQGDVLYLALEDNDRRLQNRALKLLEGQALDYDFDLATDWPRLNEGGREALEDWLIAHPQRRLVVVDTYIKVRPARKAGCDIYEEDYRALEGLKALADQYQVAILVTHHQRKATAEDVFDTMMGSGGVTGGVDNLWILARQRGRADAELHVTGRDIAQDQELALQWDAQMARFTVLGDAAEYRMSLERESVLAEVRAAGADGIGPKEVAEALGESYNTIKQRMYQMSKDGTLQLANRGRYIVGMMPHAMPTLTNSHNLTNYPNLPNFEQEKGSDSAVPGEKVSDDAAMPNLLPNFEIASQSPENVKVSKVSNGSRVANQPRSDMLLIVNARLAKAERGDPDALTTAQTYMAANDGYDWSEQRAKAERIAAGVTP